MNGSSGSTARTSGVRRAPEPVERALHEGALWPRLEAAFELEEEIGRGGMGTVLRARDKMLGRSVAVKILAQRLDEGGQVRRFVVEAQLGAQLEHPNIVPFYELLSTDEGRPAFAMRLIEGETLDAYIDECTRSAERSRTPPYDLLSRLDRFLKVCDAIDYAHARGVVHRDLKPANVMLGLHHEVYVTDWGVARVLGDGEDGLGNGVPRPRASERPLTEDGEVVGTPAYMSPEQARAEQVGPASDQYALGMMLAELVTLMPPREGGSTSKQLSLAVAGRALTLRHRFGERLPRELVAVVRKATARAPEQRYRSVAELAADVRRFVRDEAVSVLADPPQQRFWRWLKRRPLLVLGTIAACLTLSSALVALALYRELLNREEAALRADRIFALTSAVGRTAHGVDARFRRMELLLEGLARASAEILRRAPEGVLEPLEPRELAATALPAWVPRYAQKVSFERSAYVASPGVQREALAPVLARLGALEELLVQTSARAAADDEVLSQPVARWQEVARERSPVLWADLAFESGVLLVYPGNTFFPPDYDVRRRSWYTAAARRRGHVWGSPYPDATSGQLLIACSRAFHDASGKLAGVASVHVRLEDVLGVLVVPDVAGYQGSALLDRNGDVVVSERALDVKLGAGTHENRALKRAPFEVAGVRQAIRDGKPEGRAIAGERLVVFRRLDTEGWYLAVSVDAAPYGLR